MSRESWMSLPVFWLTAADFLPTLLTRQSCSREFLATATDLTRGILTPQIGSSPSSAEQFAEKRCIVPQLAPRLSRIRPPRAGRQRQGAVTSVYLWLNAISWSYLHAPRLTGSARVTPEAIGRLATNHSARWQAHQKSARTFRAPCTGWNKIKWLFWFYYNHGGPCYNYIYYNYVQDSLPRYCPFCQPSSLGQQVGSLPGELTRWVRLGFLARAAPPLGSGGSVLGLGNLSGKWHPSINNIPLSFPKFKDSFALC